MKTIEYDGATFTCPMSELFRRHTPAELDGMRDSLERLKQLDPIRTYYDTDLDAECVLDGEGRLELCLELGMKPVFEKLPEMPTDVAYGMAKGYNDARRQDDPEAIQKRRVERVARVAEKRSEGKSIRAIADEEGVSKSQVERDIDESGVTSGVPGGTPEPQVVKGKDGKRYAAKSSNGKPPPPSDELVERVATALRKNPKATDHAIAGVCDCTPAEVKAARKLAKKKPAETNGKHEPEPSEHPADPLVRRLNVLCRKLDECNAEVKEIAADPYGRHLHLESVTASIDAARKAIWQSRPTEPCTRTQDCGKGGGSCKACYGTGRTTASRAQKGGKA